MYPVMLEVRDRPCLVVGGGGVALRKVNGLLAEGARVQVVATEVLPALEKLAAEERITLEVRPYALGDAAGHILVFAATDNRQVNEQVFGDCEEAGIWANVADVPDLCSFHLPARVRRGVMQLAVASAGEAPFVVRRLRQLLERRFGEEWGEWMNAAARFRDEVRKLDLSHDEAERRFDTFFEETVDPVRLLARVPTAEEEQVYLEGGRAAGEVAPAEPRTEGRCRATPQPGVPLGFVSLVGSGPGDPGLFTMRGHRCCMEADVIVYDRLAAPAIPMDLPAEVELHPVGKQASRHPVPQEEINAMLVRLAREGKRVVRLKGGDPFVFGRGSEEAEELASAGVPFEVVPAVTAGIAVPAYAGIPVTHRREAVRICIVTAHEAIKDDGPQVRWDLMASDPALTILGYMGVTYLPGVVDRLLGAGMNPDTPAAMIERGTTSAQRVVRSTVSKLPTAIVEAGLNPPGLFVIGPTVNHADRLDWFMSRPLMGQRLLVAAPGGLLAGELERAGAEVLRVNFPITPAARIVLDALPLTGCIVSDRGEVELLDEERGDPRWSTEAATWCLGAPAAERARDLGWREVREVPAGASPAEVVDALAQRSRAR